MNLQNLEQNRKRFDKDPKQIEILYNNFKNSAIKDLEGLKNPNDIINYNYLHIGNSVIHLCENYNNFVKKFNNEKITDVPLHIEFVDNFSICNIYYYWGKKDDNKEGINKFENYIDFKYDVLKKLDNNSVYIKSVNGKEQCKDLKDFTRVLRKEYNFNKFKYISIDYGEKPTFKNKQTCYFKIKINN
jgi:hypothetical protein